jgi:hypothetical protein
VKQNSTHINGFSAIIGIVALIGPVAALIAAPALAEDFTAGKTPAQLFRSDCGACHHSPNGLVKERGDIGGLTAFLSEHYTTKSETAAALAAYVSGFASPGGRSRGPAPPGRERRSRGSDDAPVTGAEAPAETKPADDTAGRRRRAVGDGAAGNSDKRRARDDGDVPRPPRGVGPAGGKPASGVNAPAGGPSSREASQPEDAGDPATRLRTYLSSGLDSENASAQAVRTGAPKVHKRRPGVDDAAAVAPASADAPPAADAAPRSGASVEGAPGAPQ